MSRSYKKHPYEGCGSDKKHGKKHANRKVRRTEDVPNGKAYKKLYNSYNIVDYIARCSWEEFLSWGWVKNSGMTDEEKLAEWKRKYLSK